MANELAGESSPYLRQHADNPVNWLPWSQQALDLAREQNKPIPAIDRLFRMPLVSRNGARVLRG